MSWQTVELGEKFGLTIGYDCFGCRSVLQVKIDSTAGYSHDDAGKVAKDLGWVSREYAPNSKPWYCGEDCAENSPQALYCKAYWKKFYDEHKP